MIKAILFDMDGVIIDSNHIHYETWSEVFKKYSIKIDKKEFGMHLGESAYHFTEHFVKSAKIKETTKNVLKLILEQSKKDRHKVLLKEGVKETLPKIKRRFKIALATGANREWADYIVKKYSLDFDFIIGGDEVNRAKPSPEIFLRCAMKLGALEHECVVIEDAIFGMQAAKRAGMRVIAIPDAFTKYQDHSIADISLKTISELPAILDSIN